MDKVQKLILWCQQVIQVKDSEETLIGELEMVVSSAQKCFGNDPNDSRRDMAEEWIDLKNIQMDPPSLLYVFLAEYQGKTLNQAFLCAPFLSKMENVRLFSSSFPRLDKCHETSQIFPRTEQTFASARSFGVIS